MQTCHPSLVKKQRLSPATLGMVLLAAVVLALGVAPAVSPAVADEAESDKKELPEPEELTLTAGDGMQLAVTYYPGTKGKQSIPVVLLHMWKQSRSSYRELALALQAAGHAVIVPDLRWHGDSCRVKDSPRDDKLDAATMPPLQFSHMATLDMRAIKVFLWEKNNAGMLNIEKLCVVGAEMGASVALNFAGVDAVEQDSNPVRRPEYQLGRFVKALVLISPQSSFKGLPIRDATAHPAVQRDIAMLIIVGKQDGRAMQDAKRIHSLFDRFHPEPTGDSVSEKNDKRTLFFIRLDTPLQGTELLDPSFHVSAIITDFINRRLVKSEESKAWNWTERKIPHE